MAKSKSTNYQELVLTGDIGSCLDLLWRNRDASSVVVDFSNDGISQSDCLTLFRSLAHYPKMLHLRVCDLINPLPVKALTAIFYNAASQLRHLTLENVTLTGKVGDYMVMVESLRLCSLQSFRMYHCEFDDITISLDPLVRGLATIATLEQLTLVGTNLAPKGFQWTPQCLVLLLPQLRSLTIKDLPHFHNQQLTMMASALEESRCALRELTIQQQNLTSDSIRRIAQMLQKNTSLQAFSVNLHCAENAVVIGQSLIEKIKKTEGQQQGQGQDATHPSSHEQRLLQRLSLTGEWGQKELDFYSEARRVLLDMVQCNTQLTHLDLGDDQSSLSIETMQYVDMNLSNQQTIMAKKWTPKSWRRRRTRTVTPSAALPALGPPSSCGCCGTIAIVS